ncbi:MAG TPA: fasciclin domain-containing protein [Allosphingosinicella sp.]|jgi:uncharacterized surface protein with fasciclin (FAS1) repeats|uniref:fasciclin domain-containing protein n=1 Tax=Allosphingosinicella sp. TaxID=2823234 RepID=UPI002F26FC8E
MSKLLNTALACCLLATAGCVPSTSTKVSTAATGGNAGASASTSATAAYPTVGGATMFPNRTIVQNAANSKDHTTLVAAVRAAGLVETLSGAGPFTVFAPTNAAFGKLPPGTVETLLQPANKGTLTNVLTYHVVPGSKTAAQIMADIRAGGGAATYPTAAGGTVRATMQGNAVIVTDGKGGQARVTQTDVMQSNGVIHVVDTVLLPG